jgi:hypothetical protein
MLWMAGRSSMAQHSAYRGNRLHSNAGCAAVQSSWMLPQTLSSELMDGYFEISLRAGQLHMPGMPSTPQGRAAYLKNCRTAKHPPRLRHTQTTTWLTSHATQHTRAAVCPRSLDSMPQGLSQTPNTMDKCFAAVGCSRMPTSQPHAVVTHRLCQ